VVIIQDADWFLNSLEQSVRDDIAILKANPFIRKELAEHANGFVYDLKSGVLTPVKA
jgi:carbonic anhydrase